MTITAWRSAPPAHAEIVQLAADLADCLHELRFSDEGHASYQDTIDTADAVLARAVRAGLLRSAA